ncbi:hypothetical protein JCGZ_21578 [Jatropha curcas]|uniref:DOG1 domain-containing protein n=1 Tax=Jatropha curcas TaxID=180498 RepID=A0A067JBG0_JATCU|nr:protein DELAY OF GERMINATION 1 [Jatropha curcas]KDP21107.1 hypothetical protein JCGZ_21578 [Jatropha curcas]
MATENEHNESQKCFLDWMKLQEQDLGELLQVINQSEKPPDTVLTQLAEKSIQHFQDYIQKRSHLYQNNVSHYFAPGWNSALENSFLWLAGCRPSIFIRLVYALCGSEVESNLAEYLQGARIGNLGELSARQLNMVNNLHSRTIKQEEKLSSQLASLQEEIADEPISILAKSQSQASDEPSDEVDRALQDLDVAMARILQEADNFRLSTVKELNSILNPIQAIDFLAAAKKLHLCMHDWGKRRDLNHGRKN